MGNGVGDVLTLLFGHFVSFVVHLLHVGVALFLIVALVHLLMLELPWVTHSNKHQHPVSLESDALSTAITYYLSL